MDYIMVNSDFYNIPLKKKFLSDFWNKCMHRIEYFNELRLFKLFSVIKCT